MTDIFIVIESDRHSDVEVHPFTLEPDAVASAEQAVGANCRHPELLQEADAYELTDGMRAAGWVWHCRYGVEGDNVRVVKRTLR
jgi:hypothetical protein